MVFMGTQEISSEGAIIEGGKDPQDRILTIPNLITVVRLALLPVFVWLLLSQNNRAAAAILLGTIGATDWVDGWFARRFDQVSNFGKVLDPVADRMLFFVSIVAIIIDGGAPLWFCIAVFVREILVSIATLVLAALGARRIDVTWSGKAGTFGLMFAFPLFLLAASGSSWEWVWLASAWICAIPGLALSYWATVLYVPLGLRALREGRSGQSES
ncbi:PgsA Phosphatidylglycerophosphate synthase [Acidimicrobiia bacterium]